MIWLALLAIPGFIYFRLNSNSDVLKDEKESWPFVLLVLVASAVFFLLARISEVILGWVLLIPCLAGFGAKLRSFWSCFIPDSMPVEFSFTLLTVIVASIIAILLAKSTKNNIFQPLFRSRSDRLLEFLGYFIEDDAEGDKSKPNIPVMVETESEKVYIGSLVEFSLDSSKDPDSKFLIMRPSFSAIRIENSVLYINTLYTPNYPPAKNPPGTRPIDILIRWNTVKTVREFDLGYMLQFVKAGTVKIDEKISKKITSLKN